jgi:hypothetical protein
MACWEKCGFIADYYVLYLKKSFEQNKKIRLSRTGAFGRKICVMPTASPLKFIAEILAFV